MQEDASGFRVTLAENNVSADRPVSLERTGICVLAYGGPEDQKQVSAFLDSILAKKPIPAQRRKMIENRYEQCGNLSPLNEQCRLFLSFLADRLSEKFPNASPKIYWGNLHSDPPIAPIIERLAADGIEDLILFAAAPFDGRNGTGKYFDYFRRVLKSRDLPRLRCRFIDSFDENQHYLRAASDKLLLTLAQMDLDTFMATDSKADQNAHRFLIFSAHSIPEKEAISSNYSGKIQRYCEAILSKTQTRIPWSVAFQSRSGSPAIPWIGPSLEEVIRQRKEICPDLSDLIIVPVGFFFENMETIYDLDVEAAQWCRELGLRFYRAECPGATDRAAQMLTDLVAAWVTS